MNTASGDFIGIPTNPTREPGIYVESPSLERRVSGRNQRLRMILVDNLRGVVNRGVGRRHFHGFEQIDLVPLAIGRQELAEKLHRLVDLVGL